MVKDIPHPKGKKFKSVNTPITINKKRGLDVPLSPPLLGEHSYEILTKKLSMSDKQFLAHCKNGVIKDGRYKK
jgi:crotonobetainyl-CoA:carnitine CoA-transferase CaiB-like acyl-CoA transferase